MSQNRIALQFDVDRLNSLDAIITALEGQLTDLIGLSPDERRELTKMGDKSEAFCRQAVTVLSDNAQVLPRNFDVDAYRADLAALDALRPRLARVQRLYERMADSEMALGSDLMVASLEGCALLKVAGRGEGLDALRQSLGVRFDRKRRREPEPAAYPGARCRPEAGFGPPFNAICRRAACHRGTVGQAVLLAHFHLWQTAHRQEEVRRTPWQSRDSQPKRLRFL